MSEEALIIFVRNPVPGKVKTRLISSLGVEKATRIYKILLQHTAEVCQPLSAEKFVYYADEINENDLWDNQNYQKALQSGKDLGERMQKAFSEVFNMGFKHIIIIGSDCYDLQTEIIEQGFRSLQYHDAVMGPAEDGGYYLLGLTRQIPRLFNGKVWSSSSVASDTISDLKREGFKFKRLPTLKDVDLPEDAEEILLRL